MDYIETLRKGHIECAIKESYRCHYETIRFFQQEIKYALKLCELRKTQGNRSFYEKFENRMKIIHGVVDHLLLFLDSFYNGREETESKLVKFEEMLKLLKAKEGLPYTRRKSNCWFNATFMECIRWLDETLGELGQTLQDCTIALTHRRFRGGSSKSFLQFRSPEPKLRLAEVHADYPDVFRFITSIVGNIFDVLRREFIKSELYGNIAPPIVVIARGENFCFEYFFADDEVPLFLYKDPFLREIYYNNIDYIREYESDKHLVLQQTLKDYIKYYMSLSRVVTPRFFPTMLRYGCLLAHEMFHPLVRMAELIYEVSPSITKADVTDREKRNEELGGVFGDAMSYLTIDRQSLQMTIYRLLCSIYNWRSSKYTRSDKRKINGNLFGETEFYISYDNNQHFDRPIYPSPNQKFYAEKEKRRFMATLEAKALGFSREILCDIFGLITYNQSYLYALTCNAALENYSCFELHTAKDGKALLVDKHFLGVDHPPHIVRISILLEIAQKMGFKRAVKRTNELISKIGKITGLSKVHKEVWRIWKDKWWNDEGSKLISDIVQSFRDFTTDSSIYDSCLDVNKGFQEEKLEEIFKNISNQINMNVLHFDDEDQLKEILKGINGINIVEGYKLTQSDLLNIIWFKLLSEDFREDHRQRLQWRIILSGAAGD